MVFELLNCIQDNEGEMGMGRGGEGEASVMLSTIKTIKKKKILKP